MPPSKVSEDIAEMKTSLQFLCHSFDEIKVSNKKLQDALIEMNKSNDTMNKRIDLLESQTTIEGRILINQVLTTGIFPDKLKIAKVIPVYEKGEKQFSVIIGLYHFYQLFQKYLKKIFLNNYHLI